MLTADSERAAVVIALCHLAAERVARSDWPGAERLFDGALGVVGSDAFLDPEPAPAPRKAER